MDYSKNSDNDLKFLYEQEREKENEAYQKFCHCAASRCNTYVKQFCESGKICKEIKNELKRRENKK